MHANTAWVLYQLADHLPARLVILRRIGILLQPHNQIGVIALEIYCQSDRPRCFSILCSRLRNPVGCL